MVVIRLARGGAKNRPFFNIVATFRIANDRLTHWTNVGAQVSPTVARLVKQHAVKDAAPAA